MTMALPDLGLELGLGLGFGLRFSGGSLGECRVRIGAGRAGAGVAVEVRKAREGGVAMDAAVHEGLETLLGDDLHGVHPPGESVGGGGGELEAEQAEHQDHDPVAMVGAERAVGLSCSRTEWCEAEVRAKELSLGVRLGSGSEGSSRWALPSR